MSYLLKKPDMNIYSQKEIIKTMKWWIFKMTPARRDAALAVDICGPLNDADVY